MKIAEIFKEIVHRIGFDERSSFVLQQIDETNMRIAIPITIYTLVVERFMYNRTVLLWGLVTKKMYNLCFTVLAVCSIQLLVIAMLYLAGKLRKTKVARASMLIFNIACFTAGQIISVYDYAIGKQVFIFLPMVSWIFALMILNPFVSVVGALLSFIIIPEYTNNRVIMSNYVNRILVLFAVMMVIISIVRWVDSIRNARNTKKINDMNDRLSEISLKDELTGIKNRYGLRQDADQFREHNIVVAMADIDDFKYYNDTYGHDTGDDVLKYMAETLTKNFGKDEVYRFGGDEFLIVLKDHSEADFLGKVLAWKNQFHVFEHVERTLHLASTVGYTYGFCQGDDDLGKMIQVADAKLYDGKMNHKGTTNGCFYEDSKKNPGPSLDQIQGSLRTGEMDSLTKLPNMMYFRSRANLTVDILRGSGKVPVLAYLNLSKFKDYNRKNGFEAGDRLLVQFANYLVKLFPDDLVCRFADDHFAVLTVKDGIEDKIRDAEEEMMRASGNSRVYVRAGLYELSDDAVDVSLACDCARQAMEIETDGEILHWYDESMRQKLEIKQYITDHLEEALKNNWIEVLYQPIIRAVNRYVCGMEALPRWNDPVHGVLEPELYVPVLEEARLIFDHDMYVLKNALSNFSAFRDAGHQPVPIVLNLSYRDLDEEQLIPEILKITEGIDHKMVHFDISAVALARSTKYVQDVLNELNSHGYQLWMDGFGTGNSTVDILYHFNMHGIKIDIRNLHNFKQNNNDKILMHHIISMCKEMNIATLALGVETKEEEKYLRDRGCEYLQGYWFSDNISFEQCMSGEINKRFTIESPEEEPYYAAIGHIDLSRPTRIDSKNSLENVTEELPAAICECRDGHFTVLRYNREFVPFLKSVGIRGIGIYEMRMNFEGSDLRKRILELCEQILETGEWGTMVLGGAGKRCTGSFHIVSRDPAHNAFSVLGVIADMRAYMDSDYDSDPL